MTDAPSPAAPTTAPRLGRRTYVVDRRFQYKYTALLALLGGGISAVFGILMYLAHRDALDAVLSGRPLPPGVAAQNDTLLWLLAGITALMALALGLFGLLVTHRVAGPVYVMSHYVGVLARGRYPLMRPLRKGDELRDFFESFRAAVEALRAREVSEAEEIDRILEAFEPLAATPEAKERLQTLREVNLRKRDATDRVDIGGGTGQKSAA